MTKAHRAEQRRKGTPRASRAASGALRFVFKSKLQKRKKDALFTI
jgi:hypothetical protein